MPGRVGRSVTPRFSSDFGGFDGRAWLNTAHQGALPVRAGDEAREAIRWKLAPYELTPERFRGVPSRLRSALGRLLGVASEDVILANSASYGLHLVAQAFPWERGDEVLVVAGDFPSDILPWLVLEERVDVKVRRIRPANWVVEAHELEEAITPRTRLLCTTWVHSFSGRTIDLERIGAICRKRDVVFLLNASQGLGASPLDASSVPIDGLVSAGFKWLCGPYGTGVCWLRPGLRDRLLRTQAYWLAMQTQEELGERPGEAVLKPGLGAQAYDVFGTANFLNFKPFAAAVEYLLEVGIDRVRAHDQELVSRFVRGLPDGYRLLSPREGPLRSTLVFFSHRVPARNRALHAALSAAGVDVALRNGALRLSPHLYNEVADIDRALAALGSFPD
jgi:cysteine desulfurase/selenocysteine lyase